MNRDRIRDVLATAGAGLTADNFPETALSLVKALPDIVCDSWEWNEDQKHALEELIGQAVWLMEGTGFLRVWAARERQMVFALGNDPEQISEAQASHAFSQRVALSIEELADRIDRLEKIRDGLEAAHSSVIPELGEDGADVIRRKLEAFIARVRAIPKTIGYSADVYTDSEQAPGVLICTVMCGSDRDAVELHAMIDQVISGFFRRYAA